MKTPTEYVKNLNNHIITAAMLSDCLYGCNKRAKNWRDKERQYRSMVYDTYDNKEKARDKKESYYWQKERLLSVLDPVCIHRESQCRSDRERIYEYEDEYWEYKEQGAFVHEGRYFDKDIQDFVYFGDITVNEHVEYKYYLFYDLGCGHTFHTPLDEKSAEKWNLDIVDIGSLVTFGDKIGDLISCQFVKKVIALIESGDYKLILDQKK